MQEKCLIGFVIYNRNNQFLLTRTTANNFTDYALVSKEIVGEISNEKLNNILKQNLCLNINTNNASVLMQGNDLDGKFAIYSLELNKNANLMLSVINNKTEFLWLSYSQINKLFNEKRINADQLACLTKCYNFISKQNSLIKTKIKENIKKERKPLIYADPDEEYAKYVEKHTDRRILARIINGRKINPCGKECREQGYLIAQSWHHSSFENFKELMDDEEFILSAAEITPNPVECGNYFYKYVNEYLKAKPKFRLKFLKQIYLNLNVYKLEDINLIIEELNLQNENETILNDNEFKKIIERKFDKTLKSIELKYHCSGSNKKELRKYKITANELKIKLENIKNGLTEIINSFKVGEKITEPNFEPSTFYEFICSQTFKPKSENIQIPETKEEINNTDNDYTPNNYYEFLLQQSKRNNKNNSNGFNSNF